MEQEPPKRKKKAKRRANRAALEQKRQEIEMETFKEFASTVTADYLAEMCRFGRILLVFFRYHVTVLFLLLLLKQCFVNARFHLSACYHLANLSVKILPF